MLKVIVTMAGKMWTGVLYKANLNGTIVSRGTQYTRNMWTKSYSLVLMVLLFTIVNSYIPEEGKICVDGKRFDDGCNWCSCGKGFIACTKKACYGPDGVMLQPKEPPADFWQENKTR